MYIFLRNKHRVHKALFGCPKLFIILFPMDILIKRFYVSNKMSLNSLEEKIDLATNL